MSLLKLLFPVPLNDVEFKPTASLIELERDTAPREAYNALASKLGVAAREGSSLEDYLAEQAIPCYSMEAVEAYLDNKGPWAWFPLRKKDRAEPVDKMHWVIGRTTPNKDPDSYGVSKNKLYDEPVPYPVLLTVEKLAYQFRDDILFFVAALDKHPDPFLMCRLRSDWDKAFVIERWDEPGFRDK